MQDNFKLYKNYKDKPVRFRIFQKPGCDDGICCSASYSDQDIWQENNSKGFHGQYYHDKELSRTEWAEKVYANAAETTQQFKDTLKAFEDNDFNDPIIKYFLSDLEDSIK